MTDSALAEGHDPRLYLHDVFSRADEFVRMRADASLQIASPPTMGRKTGTKWLFCAYLASLRVSVCLLTHFFHVSYEPDCRHHQDRLCFHCA